MTNIEELLSAIHQQIADLQNEKTVLARTQSTHEIHLSDQKTHLEDESVHNRQEISSLHDELSILHPS
jgi:uncharacterized protein YydD (DUF2326 family)